MKSRTWIWTFPLIAAIGTLAASAQQRVDFQRQKFDRSRFERSDPSAPPSTSDALAPITPAPAAPASTFTPAAPTAVPAAPAAPESPFSGPAGSTGAISNPAPWASSAMPPAGASTNAPNPLLAAPLLDQVPAKWFTHPKDHAELLELQKQTGACLLIYFKNINATSEEKGLCGWFEKAIMNSTDWRKAMRFYIKLQIDMTGGNDVLEELVAKYRVAKTPAIFVVQPDSSAPRRITVFNWPDGKPEPVEVPAVLQSLKAASTAGYQTLF